MEKGLGIFSFAAVSIFLLGLVSIFSGFAVLTGLVTMGPVEDHRVEPGQDFTLSANVATSEGETVSVWAKIWDSTGGLVWSGIMSLISSDEDDIWAVPVSGQNFPFPQSEQNASYDYAVFVNDSSGTILNQTGKIVVVDEEEEPFSHEIKLKKGWNMIALNFDGSKKNGDRAITLHQGWNLIGYSSISNPTKVSLSEKGVVQRQAAYFDPQKGTYQLLSVSDNDFNGGQGYWVYSNSPKPVEMTFKGAGGTSADKSVVVSELTFKNEATGKLSGLPSGILIYQWNSRTAQFEEVINGRLNSWEGYFVYAPAEYGVVE